MKFGLIVRAVAGVAICATGATAQVCQGDLSFRSPTHIGAALAMTDHTMSFGGGASWGHRQGLYGGGSVGITNYDGGAGNAVGIGGGVGYSMPLQARSSWQLCPGATLALGFGPNNNAGGVDTKVSTQTFTMGASTGTSVALSKTVNLLPYASAAFAHTRMSVKVNGNGGSLSDNYLLLGFGAGFQLTPSLVIRPSLQLAAATDNPDDTIFGLSMTFALPHRGR
ncbi:MAG TPA: outer membrane beta-barrel protein [Gemmatimonadaceae bacterium]|nr:outer membrane beta-barrel protein [Gemmatimonadaceae bacterium]